MTMKIYLVQSQRIFVLCYRVGTAKIEPANNLDAEKSVNVSLDEQSIELLNQILDNGFVYLNADREAPITTTRM